MAKRFTDTDKWKKEWFHGLSSEMKLFWIYILDNCDSSGVWDVNFCLAEYQIGKKLNIDKVKNVFQKQYIEVNCNKWFIKDFIEFQYKCSIDNLNPDNKAHIPIIAMIKKYDIQGAWKGLGRGLEAPKDKDKDKDKDKSNIEISYSNKNTIHNNILPTLEEVSAYCKERKNGVNAEKWFNFYQAKGWLIGKNKMKDWRAAVRTWEEKKKEPVAIKREPEPTRPEVTNEDKKKVRELIERALKK